MERDDVIATLNDLIETSRDSEKAFASAPILVKSAALKTFFEQKSARCREAVTQAHADRPRNGRRSGEEQLDERHDAPLLGQRPQLDLGMSDHAILDECERGEDVAKRSYEKALAQDLPGDVKRVIERQFAEVKANHDKVREMRNATA